MGDCARLCLGSPQSATPPAPLRERSQDRSHRVVSPGTRVTGMTSSGVGWVSTSEALSFLDGEAGPPSAAICESMRAANAAAMSATVPAST